MFFNRKINRVLKKVSEEKNEEREPLEKGDIPAMIFAALITFVPVVLVLGALVYFLMWLFVR